MLQKVPDCILYEGILSKPLYKGHRLLLCQNGEKLSMSTLFMGFETIKINLVVFLVSPILNIEKVRILVDQKKKEFWVLKINRKIKCTGLRTILIRYRSKFSLFLCYDVIQSIISYPVCTMSGNSSLDTQQRVLTKEMKYSYNLCDFQTYNKSSIHTHQEGIHFGVKFTCQECGKEFTQKGNLTKHKKAVHLGVKHPCKLCEYQTTQKYRASQKKLPLYVLLNISETKKQNYKPFFSP